MNEPTLMSLARVQVEEVEVRGRLRPVSEAGVQSLIASVEETGVMKDAIHVRKKKDGTLHLIAGAHRLEMAKRLGWVEIEAKVWTDVTDDWARLMEIDDNLAGAEMNALDSAVFLATRKAVYERLHPEAKHGGDRKSPAFKDQVDIMSVRSFATATAEKFGLTDRHVRRMIAAGIALHPDQIHALRKAPRPVSLADLQALSKADAARRDQAVRDYTGGEFKKLSHALKPTTGSVDKDPVEGAIKALRAAWQRAPREARIRLLKDQGKVIFDLLREIRGDQE
jgi:ParB family transcriptional regulator, chromosome partitioning protein